MNNLLNFTLDEIKEICQQKGLAKFRATQIFEGIYQGKAISEISNK